MRKTLTILLFLMRLGLGSMVLLNLGITSFHVREFTPDNDTVFIAVSPGWNLISVPLLATDPRARSLFPHAISDAFAYDGNYVVQDTLQPAVGYWLKFAASETVTVTGTVLHDDTACLRVGWNLIGSSAVETSVKDISENPAGIIFSNIFDYVPSSGYVQCDSLRPGKAFWIKSRQSGVLMLFRSPRPVLDSPSNQSFNQPTAIELRWHPLTDAILYHLQAASDPSFLDMILDDSLLVDTMMQFCNLPYDVNRYWRVRALYVDSMSGWSERWKYRTLTIPPPLSDSLAIFASVDGDSTGLWVIDPNTLKVTDSLVLTPAVPYNIVTSPDGALWYYVCPESLYEVDSHSKMIVNRTAVAGSWLSTDKDKRFLIVSGVGIYQFWDRSTFTLIHQDSIFGGQAVRSPTQSKFYAFWSSPDFYLKGILVYDLDSFRVERTFTIADSIRQSIMQPTALAISPDGRYLYATIFNWGAQWWGSFHVIDLTNNTVIAEYPCGAFAQIGVSPDGRYVYLSDPAGYAYGFVPTFKMLRYDVESKTMEVYIDFRSFPGISDAIITDQIVISPDGHTIFVTIDGFTVGTCDGKSAYLVKLDAESKSVLSAVPRSRFSHEEIRRLKLDKYTR